ncbi:hypothetical protein EJ02DRAFT_422117 [Clathrospora elynae]|uniref:Lysine-specific metallo-endopeptidase domain-containing protein n=1 Tax=Clathrospora elynae TaxID=706981 RepID=A0A6A5SS87_9PLEO|nr:hypothetical protein EJ02DRAFT_422117 [Clathrospora elynae]
MRAITSFASRAAENALAPYLRYFARSDDEDDFQKNVNDIFSLITGTASNDGAIGSIVGTFVIDNLDFGANNPGEDDCTDEGTLAYTLRDANENEREKIHFCDPAWTRPSLENVDCGSLDPFPSTKMDTFSRIALHEMMHYSSVGPPSSLGEQIKDGVNADNERAYGPDRTHGLIAEEQDDDPFGAVQNADSYAWMALDTYASYKCAADQSDNNWATFFTQNPPDYVPEDDSDSAKV